MTDYISREAKMPHLKSVENELRIAFPTHKIFRVWGEECPWRVGMVNVRARVDNSHAYITLDPFYGANEYYVADILIAKIKEVLDE